MPIRYGLISDVHANHLSLKVALEALQGLGVDIIYAAGDIVGYGGAPNEVISLLRKNYVKSCLGNHDFLYMIEMNRQGLEVDWPIVNELKKSLEMMNYRPVAEQMIEWQLKKLTPENRRWIGSLPITLTSDNKMVSVIHGSPPLSMKDQPRIEFQDYAYALGKYLFPWQNQDLGIACSLQATPILIIGHSHMQFAHQANSFKEKPIKHAHPCLSEYSKFPIIEEFSHKAPLIINPGSTAQSRDEVLAPGFAILELRGKKKKIVSWYRYEYDYDEYEEYLRSHSTPTRIQDREFWKIAEKLN